MAAILPFQKTTSVTCHDSNASAAEKLEETGVESISDPDNFPLSERQRRACAPVQTAPRASVRNWAPHQPSQRARFSRKSP
jgi:hypothetical protein